MYIARRFELVSAYPVPLPRGQKVIGVVLVTKAVLENDSDHTVVYGFQILFSDFKPKTKRFHVIKKKTTINIYPSIIL